MNTMNIKEWKIVEEPVTKNGKPSKRTKKVWKEHQVEYEVEEINIRGNIYYAKKCDANWGRESWRTRCMYHADGRIVKGNFLYGRSGTKHHEEVLLIDEKDRLITTSSGWQGACGRGWGGYLVDIIK